MGAFSTEETKMTDLYTNVKSLISYRQNPRIYVGLSALEILKEFSTYNLQVPRRTGKTTTITRLSKELSALTFYNYFPNRDKLRTYETPRGINYKGMKYQCILLDEYKGIPEKVYEIYEMLRYHGLTTDDLFILNLYT